MGAIKSLSYGPEMADTETDRDPIDMGNTVGTLGSRVDFHTPLFPIQTGMAIGPEVRVTVAESKGESGLARFFPHTEGRRSSPRTLRDAGA